MKKKQQLPRAPQKKNQRNSFRNQQQRQLNEHMNNALTAKEKYSKNGGDATTQTPGQAKSTRILQQEKQSFEKKNGKNI